MMHVETSVALNFVISYLYNKLPRRRVDMFGEELEKGLRKKFEGHWYPDKPFKGSAFRCIRVSGEKIDPVIVMAAHTSGLDIEEVKDYLPPDLTIWIDPSEVSYRIGEKGIVKILYSDKSQSRDEDAEDKEVQSTTKGFNPEAQSFKPIDSLSSSLSNLSLSPSPNGWGSSPSGPSPSGSMVTSSTSPACGNNSLNTFLNRGQTRHTFMTAATFAQTKFGSTKLKSQAKRPTRLSPTEFSAYIKQRQVIHNGNPGVSGWGSNLGSPTGVMPQLPSQGTSQLPHQSHPRTLSPRDPLDPRNDLMEQHQRMLLLQQQQQQQQQQQLLSAALFNPIGGSLNNIYNTQQAPGSAFGDLSMGGGSNGPAGMGPSSPDANKTLMDALNLNSLPPYANLQHLLVAN